MTESQCRPLAKLTPDKQREAWQKAIDIAQQGNVTAAIVGSSLEIADPAYGWIAPLIE